MMVLQYNDIMTVNKSFLTLAPGGINWQLIYPN